MIEQPIIDPHAFFLMKESPPLRLNSGQKYQALTSHIRGMPKKPMQHNFFDSSLASVLSSSSPSMSTTLSTLRLIATALACSPSQKPSVGQKETTLRRVGTPGIGDGDADDDGDDDAFRVEGTQG
mmetsp:Transcript_8901/g.22876  ORF Transcript_8901/g.22876 Transcript_8901/m.22876 type:complete len:125 (+) Transcript_8901:246-620(+)